jgi:hypothetical protein
VIMMMVTTLKRLSRLLKCWTGNESIWVIIVWMDPLEMFGILNMFR